MSFRVRVIAILVFGTLLAGVGPALAAQPLGMRGPIWTARTVFTGPQFEWPDPHWLWSPSATAVANWTPASALHTGPPRQLPHGAWDHDGTIDHGPVWRVTADALFMERSQADSVALMENPFNASQQLNADDFNFPYRPGWDVSIMRHLGQRHAIEANYFEIDGWDATAVAVTDVGSPLRINTAPPTVLVTGRTIAATYDSELHNFELNWCGTLYDGLSVLAGFRYVELDEQFHADLVDAITPSPTVVYDTATRNRLYGFQVGVEAVLPHRGHRWEVNATGKAGVYGNAAAHDSLLNTGVVTSPAMGATNESAFVGEVSLMGLYRLNNKVALRGGYQILWIDGVAIASDQIAATDFIAQTGIDSSGGAFYHGAFIGLEYAP